MRIAEIRGWAGFVRATKSSNPNVPGDEHAMALSDRYLETGDPCPTVVSDMAPPGLRLTTSSDFDVRDHFEALSRALPDLEDKATGLLDLVDVNPGRMSAIVLMSTNPYVGDTFIHTFSQITHLRERYPDVPIKIIAPSFGGLLNEIDGVEHVPIRLPDATNAFREEREHPERLFKELESAVQEHVPPGAFMLWNSGGIRALELQAPSEGAPPQRRARLSDIVSDLVNRLPTRWGEILASKGCVGIDMNGMFGHANEFRIYGDEAILRRAGRRLGAHARTYGHCTELRLPVGTERTKASPMHVQALLTTQLLFGEGAYLDWPGELYAKRLEPTACRALRRLDSPAAPYVIVNLATAGPHKKDIIRRNGGDILNGTIDGIRDRFPEANVLLTPAAKEHGAAFQKEIDALLETKNRDGVRVVSMPERTDTWGPLISGAQFVITWDSGFAQIAPVFLDPSKVLSISVERAGNARHWHHVGQPAVHLPMTQRTLFQQVINNGNRLPDAAFKRLIDDGIYPFIDAQIAALRA